MSTTKLVKESCQGKLVHRTHEKVNLSRKLARRSVLGYRKPPTISPGLIYFRKRFLMGLYKGGLIYGGGLIHGRSFVLAINKSDIKQVSQKQENKHVLSSDYWAYIN